MTPIDFSFCMVKVQGKAAVLFFKNVICSISIDSLCRKLTKGRGHGKIGGLRKKMLSSQFVLTPLLEATVNAQMFYINFHFM